MDKNTLAKICCPFDKSDVQLKNIEQTVDGDVIFGYLSCKTCDRIYPILSGVPIMTPDEYRDEKFERNLYKLLEDHIGDLQIKNFRLLPKA
ncbi:Trm112 family protein [Sphingobacterium rhinopitheci]|uniref:Trm112 family protein n=1 Tax=Sphingobacterium rhinopitheci TaxID=2781960 RepID=UPI001F52B462|nr:Trm112 family protein [Sphingobacterium rhinopitheci]MCI0921118.1 hypothetical protein [Sphingobacterium rhinopitheci]